MINWGNSPHLQREHVCQLCAPEEKRFSTANRLKSHLRQVHAAAASASPNTAGRGRSPSKVGQTFHPKGIDHISISREISIDGQETTVVEVISIFLFPVDIMATRCIQLEPSSQS